MPLFFPKPSLRIRFRKLSLPSPKARWQWIRALGLGSAALVPVAWALASGAGDGAAARHQAEGRSNLVILGSWNIEHLGERAYGQSEEALAQHLILAGVDVLALQEISDTDGVAATRTSARLERALGRLPGSWDYRLVEPRVAGQTDQLAGLAWNRDKVHMRESWRLPVSRENAKAFFRPPRAFFFETGTGTTDFVVVPLHLKSSYGDAAAGRAVREAEGRALAAVMPAVREHFGAERDVVLAGDFNCTSHDEPALEALAGAGFVDLNAKDAVTYNKGRYASPLDRFLVPGEEPEFRFSRQYVLTPANPAGHQGSLSDHYLVLTAMRILQDDDGK